MLWNDKRPGKGMTEHTGVSDADHAVLDTAWNKSFADLKKAGVAHDADHPVAASYRQASNAVNHANRSRDYGIATGRIK